MKIFISMFLSSNSLLLLFIITERFMGNVFSQKNKYLILKVALFFSIIPLGGIKLLVTTVINYYFPSIKTLGMSINGRIATLVITPTRYFVSSNYRNTLLLLLVWFLVALIMVITYLRKQYTFRKSILNTTHQSFAPEMLSIVKKHTQLQKISKNVRVYITDIQVSPFTVGILNPIIVMPDISDLYKQELIIKHELCHIKNHDSIIKIFQMIAIGLYWFNPLVYLLNSYLDKFCELTCDEYVATALNKKGKKNYAYLIVDLASINSGYTNSYISPFSNNKNSIQERINTIMKSSKKSKLAVLLTSGMVLFSSIPVLADQTPEILFFEQQQPSKDSFPLNANEEVIFKELNVYNVSSIQHFLFDEQFTDVNGNIYEISLPSNETKRTCEHTYVDGVYEKHTKNKDGSCVTKAWECKRCSQCGALVQGSLINVNQYTKCPH